MDTAKRILHALEYAVLGICAFGAIAGIEPILKVVFFITGILMFLSIFTGAGDSMGGIVACIVIGIICIACAVYTTPARMAAMSIIAGPVMIFFSWFDLTLIDIFFGYLKDRNWYKFFKAGGYFLAGVCLALIGVSLILFALTHFGAFDATIATKILFPIAGLFGVGAAACDIVFVIKEHRGY